MKKNLVTGNLTSIEIEQLIQLLSKVETLNMSVMPNLKYLQEEMPVLVEENTLLVSFIGGPGCGKSYYTDGLLWNLRNRGVKTIVSAEYPKELVLGGHNEELKMQDYIIAKQAKSILQRWGKYQVVVCDGPFINCVFYPNMYQNLGKTFESLVINRYKSCNPLTILLERGDIPYEQEGRYQKEDEAKDTDNNIKAKLSTLGIDFVTIVNQKDKGHEIAEEITNIVIKELKKKGI